MPNDPYVQESHDAPPPKKSWTRVIVGFVITFLVVATIQYFVRSAIANRNLQAALDATDALDPAWRFDDLHAARPRIPPEENAALRAVAAARKIEKTSIQDPALVRALEEKPIERRMNARQTEAVQVLLEKNKEALELARSLKDYPQGRFDIAYTEDWFTTPIPEFSDIREVAFLLEHDILDCIRRKDFKQASASTLALFHAGTSVGDEPLAFAQLVRVSILNMALESLERILGNGELSDSILEQWQTRLAKEQSRNILLVTLQGERAGNFLFLDGLRTGKFSFDYLSAKIHKSPTWTWEERLLHFRRPEYFPNQQILVLEKMTELIQAANLPWEQRLDAINEITSEQHAGSIGWVLIPAYGKLAQAFHRRHALLLCTQTALAAERFRLAQKEWPRSIDALVNAGLLAELPLDPFDGQPLRFVRHEKGLTIYSVFLNRVDDGGRSIRHDPLEPEDLGVQLWDVSERGAKPLPVVGGEDTEDD